MTLGDLLTELRENVLHDRSSQIDGDSDKLWSDTTLIRYLNEAQRRFARKTCCIVDKTTAASRVYTVTGQDEYTLDPTIIAVKSMRFMGNTQWINGVQVAGVYSGNPIVFTPAYVDAVHADDADLGRGGHSTFDQYPTPSGAFFNPRGLSRLAPGKPMAFSTDEEFDADKSGSSGVVSLRLYPRPSLQYAGCLIQMRVCRLPSVSLTVNSLDTVPEIPEIYHLCLVDYAASRALAIVDHDLGDPQRAAEFGQKFEAEVEEAREETQRKAFAPMVWGFGRNGFAYEGN